MKSYIVIICFMLVACVNDVKFESPQPEGMSDEVLMPESGWGIYRSISDSSYLFVSPEELVRFNYKSFTTPRTTLDSAYHINGDTTFYDNENHLRIEVKGDTVFGSFHRSDTIFTISPQNVLRKYKGYYFLNKQTANGWDVYMMTIRKNELSLVTSWRNEDLAALRKITHTSDSTHHFKPTRKQIRQFIMQHGLPAGEKFRRISDSPGNDLKRDSILLYLQ